ncbi:MAG TPA: hypothetical protein VFI65_03930 [Streptosporangiaceae bacterium]|nr:hypothetical protein [Streptosporangiaceae bacterium]
MRKNDQFPGFAFRSAHVIAVAGIAAVFLATGCSTQDAICESGQYPVHAVGGTGSACAPVGKNPPAGYQRYPKGEVPQHVGDKWDKYWSSHVIDKNGKIVKR